MKVLIKIGWFLLFVIIAITVIFVFQNVENSIQPTLDPNPIVVNNSNITLRSNLFKNPFGVFYIGKNENLVQEMGAEGRFIVSQKYFTPEKIKIFDNSLVAISLSEDSERIATFTSESNSTLYESFGVGNNKYCLPEGDELEETKRNARLFAERYDGDLDFGCTVDNDVDCYAIGDSLRPDLTLSNTIRKSPIKIWQIENEFLFQMVYCSNSSSKVVPKEKMVNHIKEISSAIRSVNEDIIIISPALTGYEKILLSDERVEEFSSGATDCKYSIIGRDLVLEKIENGNPEAIKIRDEILERKEYVEYILTESKDYYDAISFHYYGNNYEISLAIRDWVVYLNLSDKEIISTEWAGPFYFFEAIGADKPMNCVETGKDNRGPSRYSDVILSEYLVKNYIIAFASGFERVHWATLKELFDPYTDNYKRCSLLYTDGTLKPAFYTYKLMTEKLNGFDSVEKFEGSNLYKFNFDNKDPVFVAWSENKEGSIVNLEDFLGEDANIVYIISKKGQKSYETKIVSSDNIIIPTQPIFIEKLN